MAARSYKWVDEQSRVRVLVVIDERTVVMHNQNCYPIRVTAANVVNTAEGTRLEQLRQAAIAGIEELRRVTNLNWIELQFS